ncbi:hypothetical protein BLNAU_4742 [Blattamonas nauphoetae]|uniref:HAT C-terminal dimerisation domain-containing protein n=1 Tax=Blattamonas nauphoetae TaxID=2049346 RepID=A0ABQ9Y911_9EUKA|nr:hypothetical protein BLNAU_4742 [Blattamonas nauphoetae]
MTTIPHRLNKQNGQKLPKDNQELYQIIEFEKENEQRRHNVPTQKHTHPRRQKGLFDQVSQNATVVCQYQVSTLFHNKVHSQSIHKLQNHFYNSLSSSKHLSILFLFSSQNNLQLFKRFMPHHLFLLKHQPQLINRRMRDIRTGFNPPFPYVSHEKSLPNSPTIDVLTNLGSYNTIIWNTLKTHRHHLSCAPLELLKEQFSEWLDHVESISESISSTKFTTFWGQYGRDKPAIELKQLACQVGSIPCSEVECERYFSYLGMHYSPERQSLDPEQLLAEMYVALK